MNHVIAPALFVTVLTTMSLAAWGENLVYKCKNVTGTLSYQKNPCQLNTETLNSWVPIEKSKPSAFQAPIGSADSHPNQAQPVLVLKQNASNHYVTAATINDKPLVFVVDTGASMVSLPESIAHQADIYCDQKVVVQTANGTTEGCTAKMKHLQFGPFSIQDVPVMINPHLDQPLLGMNVLQLFKLSQEKGELHISTQDKPHTPEKN